MKVRGDELHIKKRYFRKFYKTWKPLFCFSAHTAAAPWLWQISIFSVAETGVLAKVILGHFPEVSGGTDIFIFNFK